MPRALLIDDESHAREDLRRLLAAHPAVLIVGEAGSVAGARRRLAQPGYDLVFLDIQLIGGSGFDLVPHVAREARTIFVTAFDRFALRAFEVNALDYLLKPVAPARLAASLARLRSGAAAAAPAAPAAKFRGDDTVLVRADAGDRFVPLGQISAVFSNENYSDVQLRSAERFLTRRTMKAWEELLPPAQFMRVHRHALVNLACIESQQRDTRETAALRVTGARDLVPVSRNFLAGLRVRLGAR